MLRIFHTLAPLLALVRDAADDDRQMGILLIAGFIYQISADVSNHLLQVLVIIFSLMTVAFSLVPEHEFDVISFWQMAQLVVDAGTDILGESLEQALSALTLLNDVEVLFEFLLYVPIYDGIVCPATRFVSVVDSRPEGLELTFA